MFESEEEELTSFTTEGCKLKTRENVSLAAWANYFCKNDQKDDQLQKILHEQFCLLKRMYVFLDETQIMGKTLTKLGIPNLCGKEDKRYLKKFLTHKTKFKSYERLHKPPKRLGLSKTIKNKQHTGTTQRYQPVAERWSDIALKKGRDKINTDIPLNKTLEYDYKPTDSDVVTKPPYSENDQQKTWPRLKNKPKENKALNLSPKLNNQKQKFLDTKAKDSDTRRHSSTVTNKVISVLQNKNVKPQEEKKNNGKKSVRFDENLCSFAPTPEVFDSSSELICVDGISNPTMLIVKKDKPECEIEFDKLIEDGKTDCNEGMILPEKSTNSQSICHRSLKPTLINCQSDVNVTTQISLDNVESNKNDDPFVKGKNEQDFLKSYVIEPYSELDFTIEDSSSSPVNLEIENKVQSNITHSTDYHGTLVINVDRSLEEFPALNINSEKVEDYDCFKQKFQKTSKENIFANPNEVIQPTSDQSIPEKASIKPSTDEPVIIDGTPSTEEFHEDYATSKVNDGSFQYNGHMDDFNYTKEKNNETNTESEKYLQGKTDQTLTSIFEATKNNENDEDETRLAHDKLICSQTNTEANLENACNSKVDFQLSSPISLTSDRDYISDESQILTNSNLEKQFISQDLTTDHCNTNLSGTKKDTNSLVSRCMSPIKIIHEPCTINSTKNMSENTGICQNMELEPDLRIQNIAASISVSNVTSEPKDNKHCTIYDATPNSQTSSNVCNPSILNEIQLKQLGINLAPTKKENHHQPLMLHIKPSIKNVCKSLFQIETRDIENNSNLTDRSQIKDGIAEDRIEAIVFSVTSDDAFQKSKLSNVEKKSVESDIDICRGTGASNKSEEENKKPRNLDILCDGNKTISCDINEKLIKDCNDPVTTSVAKSDKQKNQGEEGSFEDNEYFALSDDEVLNHELSGIVLPKIPKEIILSSKVINKHKIESFEEREYSLSNEMSNNKFLEVAISKSPEKVVVSLKETKPYDVNSFEEVEVESNDEALNYEFSPETTSMDKNRQAENEKGIYKNSKCKVNNIKSEGNTVQISQGSDSGQKMSNNQFFKVAVSKSPEKIVVSLKETKIYGVNSFEEEENGNFAVSNDEVLSNKCSPGTILMDKNRQNENDEGMYENSKCKVNDTMSYGEPVKNFQDSDSDQEMFNNQSSEVAVSKSSEKVVVSLKEFKTHDINSFEEEEGYFAVSNDEVLSNEFSPGTILKDKNRQDENDEGTYKKSKCKVNSTMSNGKPVQISLGSDSGQEKVVVSLKKVKTHDINSFEEEEGYFAVSNDSGQEMSNNQFSEVAVPKSPEKLVVSLNETKTHDDNSFEEEKKGYFPVSNDEVLSNKFSPKTRLKDKNIQVENDEVMYNSKYKVNNTISSEKTVQISQCSNSNKASRSFPEQTPEHSNNSTNQSLKLIAINIYPIVVEPLGTPNSLFSPLVSNTEKTSNYIDEKAHHIKHSDKNHFKLSQNMSCSLQNKLDLESPPKYIESSRFPVENSVRDMKTNPKFQDQLSMANYKENDTNVISSKKNCDSDNQKPSEKILQNKFRNNGTGKTINTFSTVTDSIIIGDKTGENNQRSINSKSIVNKTTKPKSLKTSSQIQIITEKTTENVIPCTKSSKLAQPTLKLQNLSPIISNQHHINKNQQETLIINPDLEYDKENITLSQFMPTSNDSYSADSSTSESIYTSSSSQDSLPGSLAHNYPYYTCGKKLIPTSKKSKLRRIKRKLELQDEKYNNPFSKSMSKKSKGDLKDFYQSSLYEELISAKNLSASVNNVFEQHSQNQNSSQNIDSSDFLRKQLMFEKSKSFLESLNPMSSDDELLSAKISTVSSPFEKVSEDQSYSQPMDSNYSSEFLGEESSVNNIQGNFESRSCSLKSDPTFSPLSDDFNEPKLDNLMQDSSYILNYFEDSECDSESYQSASPREEPMDLY